MMCYLSGLACGGIIRIGDVLPFWLAHRKNSVTCSSCRIWFLTVMPLLLAPGAARRTQLLRVVGEFALGVH